VGQIAAAVTGHQPLGLRIGGVVLHDDQLGAVLGDLRGHGGQRHGEVVAAAARRDEERGGRSHARRS
jgi:hypothetical protein